MATDSAAGAQPGGSQPGAARSTGTPSSRGRAPRASGARPVPADRRPGQPLPERAGRVRPASRAAVEHRRPGGRGGLIVVTPVRRRAGGLTVLVIGVLLILAGVARRSAA